MKCPHCLESIHDAWTDPGNVTNDPGGSHWSIHHMKCPACGKVIARLMNRTGGNAVRSARLVLPKAMSRAPLSPDVPPNLSADYQEACIVLADSPKASAAVTRRCLQHLLREKSGVTSLNLDNEIQQVLDAKALPPHLAEAIDAVRVVGNFAAHPIKSKSTGEIVDVEEGEAEWLLDTVEALFDFYFVQPMLLKKRKEAINKKLAEAGKPPLK